MLYNIVCKTKKVERNIPINIVKEGKAHTTFIDFRVNNILFEVKAPHLLEGCYDYNKDITIQDKLEIYKNNNVIIVIDYKHLFTTYKYLSGVDIALFDNHSFLYSENRPKCFYNVKRSAYSPVEPFANEAVRWKMIENRIKYDHGFH